jgi:hypothetical protein
MIQKIRKKWLSSQIIDRLYWIGIAITLVGSVVSFFTDKYANFAIEIVTFVASILFLVGFVSWIWPWLKEKWQYTVGKVIISVLHAIILFASVVPSRYFVAKSLGLPPQDFDVTVGFLALELYPVMWLLVISIISLLLYVFLLIIAVLCSFTSYPLFNELTIFFSKAFSPSSKVRYFVEHGREKIMSRYFFHAIGAAIVAICGGAVWDWHSRFILQHPQPIRWVAYLADYQPSILYPGVSKTTRLRLHENGVVSYAERNGWNIQITIGKVRLGG